MSNGRKQLHPEHIEAMEVRMDVLMPGQAPLLFAHHSGLDPRRVVATVPERERHKLYLGRLVSVDMGDNTRRKGSIESVDADMAVVRYVDWDD